MRRYGFMASLVFFAASFAVPFCMFTFLFYFVPESRNPPPYVFAMPQRHLLDSDVGPVFMLLFVAALFFAAFGAGLFARKWPRNWRAILRSALMSGVVTGIIVSISPNLGFLTYIGVSIDVAVLGGFPLLGVAGWGCTLKLAQRANAKEFAGRRPGVGGAGVV